MSRFFDVSINKYRYRAIINKNSFDIDIKNIIINRFYENKTQMEIAQEIGISQAQVSRLEKNALKIIFNVK